MEKKSPIKAYFIFGLCCIAYYVIAVFAWEYFLAILITSLVWTLIMYFANQKNYRHIKEQEDSIAYWTAEAKHQENLCSKAEAQRNILRLQKEAMTRDYNKLKKEFESLPKTTAHTHTTEARDNGGNVPSVGHKVELKTPQSEASKKLGGKVHNKIQLSPEKFNSE